MKDLLMISYVGQLVCHLIEWIGDTIGREDEVAHNIL